MNLKQVVQLAFKRDEMNFDVEFYCNLFEKFNFKK